METTMIEQHVLIGDRKFKEIFNTVLDKIFGFPVSDIEIEYSDRPTEFYQTINERTKKILYSIPKPEKITSMSGRFDEGGIFKLIGSNLHIDMPETEYNYELLDSMKNFLCETFPIWLFKNPYIWGATTYEDYERQHFFEQRKYIERSLNPELPEIDIYRRDNGIICKYRFFPKDEFETTEDGFKIIASVFKEQREGLGKRNYEGMEIFNLYCADKPTFRKIEPRTKLAKTIKSLLSPDK